VSNKNDLAAAGFALAAKLTGLERLSLGPVGGRPAASAIINAFPVNRQRGRKGGVK
jgi:hypothetical protein